MFFMHCVPNAPCGVESFQMERDRQRKVDKFLMHRVELKALRALNPPSLEEGS